MRRRLSCAEGLTDALGGGASLARLELAFGGASSSVRPGARGAACAHGACGFRCGRFGERRRAARDGGMHRQVVELVEEGARDVGELLTVRGGEGGGVGGACRVAVRTGGEDLDAVAHNSGFRSGPDGRQGQRHLRGRFVVILHLGAHIQQRRAAGDRLGCRRAINAKVLRGIAKPLSSRWQGEEGLSAMANIRGPIVRETCGVTYVGQSCASPANRLPSG